MAFKFELLVILTVTVGCLSFYVPETQQSQYSSYSSGSNTPQNNYPNSPQNNYPNSPQNNYPNSPQNNYANSPQNNYPNSDSSSEEVDGQARQQRMAMMMMKSSNYNNNDEDNAGSPQDISQYQRKIGKPSYGNQQQGGQYSQWSDAQEPHNKYQGYAYQQGNAGQSYQQSHDNDSSSSSSSSSEQQNQHYRQKHHHQNQDSQDSLEIKHAKKVRLHHSNSELQGRHVANQQRSRYDMSYDANQSQENRDAAGNTIRGYW